MAEVIRIENRNGVEVSIYDNGMEKSADGRIVSPPKTTQITKANSSDYHRARKEQKRALMAQALNDAVERKDFIEKYGESAWVAAVTQSAYIKATTPDDPKSIEAARFLFNETGIGEAAQDLDTSASNESRSPARVVLLLAELVNRNDSTEVIDVDSDDINEL